MKRVILYSLLLISFPSILKASPEKKTLSRASQLREKRKEFLHVSGKPIPRYALKKRALEAKKISLPQHGRPILTRNIHSLFPIHGNVSMIKHNFQKNLMFCLSGKVLEG